MASAFADGSLKRLISSEMDLNPVVHIDVESSTSFQYLSFGLMPFIKSHSCRISSAKLHCLTVFFFLATLLPVFVSCSGPVMLNVKSNPGDSIRLQLLSASSDPPLTVLFAFKTCRDVDVIRFYKGAGSTLIGSVSLRDFFLGFCMERPKRCENSEVNIALNEWYIVRISPYGTANNQLLFQTFRPDGAFQPLMPLESRVISFSFTLPNVSSGIYAELPASFRGCFSPSVGFDLQYITTSEETASLIGDGSCFMDVAWPSKSARMAYAGECFLNVTCDDGNVCQRCSADEPDYCSCVFPYRPSVQQSGISQCSVVSSNNPCKTNPCRSGGTCILPPHFDVETNNTSFACVCSPLYTGPLCDTPVDPCRPNPCLNRGTCIKDEETGQATCQCHGTGFDGAFCEHDIDECTVANVIPCAPLNSVKCFNLPGSYWCSCKSGFKNQTCSEPVDPCDNSLCKNGATCVAVRSDVRKVGGTNFGLQYTCTCPAGFGGQFCEVSYSSCNNFTCPFPNAVCFSSTRGSTTCMCSSNEFQLSKEKNLCYSPDPCASMPCKRGTCRPVNPFLSADVICDCPVGYTGRFCESLIDACLQSVSPCRNGGTCVASVGSFSCNCQNGFEPPFCDPINYCSLGVCKLNGSQSVDCVSDRAGYKCICKPGWTGVSCTSPIDACANKPCLNGGLCQVTKPGAFKCVCPAGYSGKLCNEIPISLLCDVNKCMNGGTCQSGYGPYEVCLCKPGWIGLACETRDPCYPNPCGVNGQCYELQDPKTSYQCRCYDGWSGPDCSVRIASSSTASPICTNDSFCEPGGRCQEGACVCNKASFTLSTPFNSSLPPRVIEVGWSGLRCDLPLIPDPCAEYPPICKNGARCTRHDPENSLGFFCNCGRVMTNTDFQYTGGRCEEIMGQYCHLSLCQNGGTCVPSGESAACICPSGYTGKNCEQTIAICGGSASTSPCLNGGTCIQGSSGDPSLFICNCAPGYSGIFCEAKRDLCIPNPCKNDGTCSTNRTGGTVKYSCNCSLTGYSGPTCETTMDLCSAHPCQNGGSCLQVGGRVSCKCLEGFGGNLCQTILNPCQIQPSPCQGGATCIQLDRVRSPLAYSCMCPPGLTGAYCEQQINYCANITCYHGGNCVNDADSFHCVCKPGFTGMYCDSDIDECKLFAPCAQSGAPCRNTMGSYECDCRSISSRWVDGKNCTVLLTGCAGKNLCHNGGTCTPILVDERRNIQDFYCLCPLSWTGAFCEIANVVSFYDNASMIYQTPVKQLPLTLSFDIRTTIADGSFLDVVFYGNSEMTSKRSSGQPIISLYLLRGYLRGFLLQQSSQFAFPYSVDNDVWTSVEIVISEDHSAVIRIKQSTCDFPYCRFMFNASLSSSPLFDIDSSHNVKFYFGSMIVPTQNGFVGCLRNISVNSDLVITSPATLSKNTKIGCRQESQCSPAIQTCNGNGVCKDRWVKAECKCFPGYDGSNCSQRLPKYTLGIIDGGSKSLRFLPMPTFKYPTEFAVAFRSAPTYGNVSVQILMIAFASNVSQVGFLWTISNGMLFMNGESQHLPIDAGYQHLLEVSIVPAITSGVLVKAKLNGTTIMSFSLSAESSVLQSILLGSLPNESPARLKRDVMSVTGGYFIADMIEVNGDRMSTASTTIGGLAIDASLSYAGEYLPQVCRTKNPCANGGSCVDSIAFGFQCHCTKGFSGRTCTEPQPCDYLNCPASLACYAKAVDKAFCASPISLDGSREFVEFASQANNNYNFDSQAPPFTVHFEFRTKQRNGIFIFAVAKTLGKFLLIEVLNGHLVLSHNMQQNGDRFDGYEWTTYIKTEQVTELGSISDGVFNMFDLETVNAVMGSQLRLRIINVGLGNKQPLVTASIPFPPPPFYANTGFSLFIGGVPSDLYRKYRYAFSTKWNMTMCIQNSSYANTSLVTVMPRSLSSRFGTYQPSSLAYGFQQLLSVTERATFSYGCPPSSPCSISPDLAVCLNSGMCTPEWLDDYSCSCPVGFAGKYCQLLVSSCMTNNPCGADSSCFDLTGGGYRCSCPAGRTGERCEGVVATTPSQRFFSTSICSTQEPCARGKCFDDSMTYGGYRCICDGTGYGGQNCTVPLSQTCSATSEAPCLNDGVCLNVTSDGPQSTSFKCSCKNGFFGTVCEFPVDWCAENKCLNGAKCVPQAQDQNYSCTCAPGFTGSMCETKTNFCSSNPCFNKGICNNTAVGYNCSCLPGFYGANCQLREAGPCDTSPCTVGKCIEIGDNYTCDCSGEVGLDASTCKDIDECTPVSPCKHGGTCINTLGGYTCTCTLGFEGENCSNVNCTAVNCNHGRCEKQELRLTMELSWKCVCDEYYHGDFCNTPSKCAARPCINGTCVEQLASDSYICRCNEGWLNANCSTLNCTLDTNYCSNGGRCRMMNDSLDGWVPECECPTGWSAASLCAEELKQELPAEWIWAPIVAVVAAALLICGAILVLRIKQKRATGGNYSPSRQEAIGTRVELEDIIKPPPEERLI